MSDRRYRRWHQWFPSAAVLLLSASARSTAEPDSLPIIESKPPPEITAEETTPEPLELGLSLGVPVIVNAEVGYWARSVPLVTRLSGIYLGDTRGIELDVGYRFSFFGNEREYLALSFASWQVSSSFTSWFYVYTQSQKDAFNGIGPSLGFNLNGLSVQLGILLGQLRSSVSYDAGPSGTGAYGSNSFSVQPEIQIGYSCFF